MKKWIYFISMAIGNLLMSQIQIGEVHDSVVCNNDKNQTYALYLPSNYSAEKQWPVIFFFEPAARGRLPIDNYKIIAEELGYILICSNNSRNGAWDSSFYTFDILLTDVISKFSIDRKSIYTCGFSGGSRLAMAVAVLNGQIRGVIGVGAVQSLEPQFRFRRNQTLLYIGLVGVQDMNYLEHKKFAKNLNEWNKPNLLLISDLNHQWADALDFRLGLLWLSNEIDAKIEVQKEMEVAFKAKYKSTGDKIPQLDWIDMQKNLHVGIVQEVSEKEVEKMEKLEARLEAKEYKYQKEIADSLEFAYFAEESISKQTQKRVLLQLEAVRKKCEKSTEGIEKNMYLRILDLFRAVGIERAMSYVAIGEYERALIGISVFEACANNPLIANYWYAKVYALMDEEEHCFDHLEKLLELGFDKIHLLQNEAAFEQIIKTDRFKTILSAIEN